MKFFQDCLNGSWHIFWRNWGLEFAEGFRQIKINAKAIEILANQLST